MNLIKNWDLNNEERGNKLKPEVGKRVRLLSRMTNPDSKYMPEEDLAVGSVGTIINIHTESRPEFHVIEVRWDCGRGLSLLPYIDKFEVFDKEEVKNEN